MNNTFHPDEVPEGLKVAAADCQQYRHFEDQRMLGGLNPMEIPTFPTEPPPPLVDGQTFIKPVLNSFSLRPDWVAHYVAVGGRWVFVSRDLTESALCDTF